MRERIACRYLPASCPCPQAVSALRGRCLPACCPPAYVKDHDHDDMTTSMYRSLCFAKSKKS